jgi:pimeloyl-ACP methyl ester carboxylesterase
VVPLLAGEFRLICPDLRGFGWSDAPGRGYDHETFAADAVVLLEALGIERAGVIGHDWGGFTGFVVALHHPERVTGLLALGTPVPWLRLSPAALAASWRTWYAWVLATAGRRLLMQRPGLAYRMLRAGAPDEVISAHDAEVYAERLRPPERAKASQLLYRSYVRSAAELPLRRRYHGIRLTVPARLLLGHGDHAVRPALTRGPEGHADDMAVEIVDDASHFLPEERPELVAHRAAELFAS